MSFEILGVVDLRGGLAVRARGGQRDKYLPIERVAGDSVPPGDANALVRCYTERFGLQRVYVADLDAIEGRAPQAALVRSLMSSTEVWLDAGVASVEEANRALEGGVGRVIVGLETLPSFDVLESICKHVGHDRVVFSLDLRDGVAISLVEKLRRYSAHDLAVRAADAGVTAVIVLDLARVGGHCGVDSNLLARIRSAARGVDVYAGGGVRDAVDLEQVRRIGCRGALVASALLDGQLAPPQNRSVS